MPGRKHEVTVIENVVSWVVRAVGVVGLLSAVWWARGIDITVSTCSEKLDKIDSLRTEVREVGRSLRIHDSLSNIRTATGAAVSYPAGPLVVR